MTAMVLLSQWMESQVEIWKPIKGLIGYDVSTFGRVRSFHGKKRGEGCRGGFVRTMVEVPKLMKLSHKHKGSDWYKACTFQLPDSGREKTLNIHRLVAKAFIPNPEGLPEVNHKNLIKSDSRVGNLEWTDHDGNHAHMDANGMRPKGSKQWKAVITEDIARAIHQGLRDGVKGVVLAQRFGVNEYLISNIKRGRTWKHVE